jgi:hypothetical protein
MAFVTNDSRGNHNNHYKTLDSRPARVFIIFIHISQVGNKFINPPPIHKVKISLHQRCNFHRTSTNYLFPVPLTPAKLVESANDSGCSS